VRIEAGGWAEFAAAVSEAVARGDEVTIEGRRPGEGYAAEAEEAGEWTGTSSDT
jgi:hypothetical protein